MSTTETIAVTDAATEDRMHAIRRSNAAANQAEALTRISAKLTDLGPDAIATALLAAMRTA